MMKLSRRWVFHLVVSGASLMLLGLIGHRTWAALQNHGVKEWVESYGGSIDWGPGETNTPELIEAWIGEPILDDITKVWIHGSPAISVGEVATLPRLRHLQRLEMRASTFSDAHAEMIAKSQSIEILDLCGTSISDTGLKHIGNSMSQLTTIGLAQTSVSGEGLRHLAGLPNLEILSLSNCEIADSDLDALQGMDSLTFLVVGGEGITDAGIARIIQAKRLEYVCFHTCDVTDAGIDNLIQGLPNLKGIGLTETLVTGGKITEIKKSGIRLLPP